MKAEGFITWALEGARTIEERYTTEIIVELGATWWNTQNKIYKYLNLEERMERDRQRALNPAYEPCYSEIDVRHAAEAWPAVKSWWFSPGYRNRPIRDLAVFAFLTHLEEIHLHSCEATDVSVLAKLPHLRVLKFTGGKCADFSPLANCGQLRELELYIGGTVTRWPNVQGLEKLAALEKLSLVGNLHAFAPGIAWPKVRTATLKCDPLPMRRVRDLPQLPACELLTLGGVEQLDGIEEFPRLRNLRLETDTRDFAPLTALKNLTWFSCGGFEPLDVLPLTQLPKLQVVIFNARFEFALNAPEPRNFAPFADAAALRELHVPDCPPVQSEVQTLNSLLPPWDDVFLAATPRPLPAPRMIMAQKHPYNNSVKLDPEDNGLADEGLRECEGRWAKRFMEKNISAKVGQTDWGKATCDGKIRHFNVTVESFAVVEKLPLIIEAMRETFARLRGDYTAMLMVALKAPSIEPTPAQIELENQFQEERDQADRDRYFQEQKDYLERLHRYQLKKELGEEIKPEDFVPPPPAPELEPPWEREDEDDDDGFSDGDVAVKEKPDPPPSWLDDEHPLADHYRLMGFISLSEIWFMPHHRDIAVYLMRREPDLEIPEEK
jgi:hypothetical protein